MLNYDTLSKQFDELLASFSTEDLQVWLDFDNQRLLEEEFSDGKTVLCQYNDFQIVSFDNSDAFPIVAYISFDNYNYARAA